MKILAFLQNPWFKNPRKAAAIFAKYPDRHEELTARYLFCGCKTGRILRQVFGQLCDSIVWCEASPQFGTHSSSAFPACVQHMARLIRKYEPEKVLTFGKIAGDGLCLVMTNAASLFEGDLNFGVISGPHPCARDGDTLDRLRWMKQQLEGRTL